MLLLLQVLSPQYAARAAERHAAAVAAAAAGMTQAEETIPAAEAGTEGSQEQADQVCNAASDAHNLHLATSNTPRVTLTGPSRQQCGEAAGRYRAVPKMVDWCVHAVGHVLF